MFVRRGALNCNRIYCKKAKVICFSFSSENKLLFWERKSSPWRKRVVLFLFFLFFFHFPLLLVSSVFFFLFFSPPRSLSSSNSHASFASMWWPKEVLYTVINLSPALTHFAREGNWTRSRSAFGNRLKVTDSDGMSEFELFTPADRVRYAQPAVTFIKRACNRIECVGAFSSSSRSIRI